MMNIEKLPNSQPEETVEIFLRRHWIDLLKIFLFSGVLLLVPVAVTILLALAHSTVLSEPFIGPLMVIVLGCYLLGVFVLTITEITDYWLDVWIVTTERVINTEQHGLFNRLVSEVQLEQIQDITSETKGFLETFLTYGDVYVQTAGEKERFRFKNINNPDEVKITMSRLVATCQNTHHHEHLPRTVNPSLGTPAGHSG